MNVALNTLSVLYSQCATLLYGGGILLFVPLNLSPQEQGFWFTLMALGTMSRLADMGFLQLVLTYSGYAKVSAEYSKEAVILFTSNWRNKVIKFIFPVIFVFGTLVLITQSVDFKIILVWLAYVVSLILFFYINYFLSFIEGEGHLPFAHFARGTLYIVSFTVTVFSLIVLKTVVALPLGMFTGGVVVLLSIRRLRPTLFNINLSSRDVNNKELKNEFFPLFKRTTMSWTGGYLGTHAIVPLIFMISGPVASGLAGMTLNIFIALQNFANLFLVSIVPKAIEHVAKGTGYMAKALIKRQVLKTIILFYGLVTIGIVLISFFPNNIIFKRLLTDINLIFLAIGFGIQIIIHGFAIYIRAYKCEPFGVMSLVTSVLGLSVLFLVLLSSDFNNWFFIGYFLSSMAALLWTLKIFINWRGKTV